MLGADRVDYLLNSSTSGSCDSSRSGSGSSAPLARLEGGRAHLGQFHAPKQFLPAVFVDLVDLGHGI